MLEEGDIAPDFALATADGHTVSLAQLRGRPAVLFFYPRNDTAACTAEALSFSELHAAFARARVAVVGISPDTIASHARFRSKHGISVMLAADVGKAVAQAYGVWVEKTMYGRRFMGVERTTFLVTPDGRLARVWRKVKVPGHAEAVLAAATALS
jgi:peroxiredoxin Q/BCP